MILHVLPLLVFTTFAGFAAGAYAVDAVCGNGREAKTPWLFPLVCVVLLGIGLCGTLAHLGQPLRFMNGMANPASGISQESYWAIALGIVIVVDLVLSWRGKTVRAVRWVGGAVAVGFMVVTGLAYFDCLGLVAWRGAATLPVFILGDVALGAGLCAVLAKADDWAASLLCPATVAAQAASGVVIVALACTCSAAALTQRPCWQWLSCWALCALPWLRPRRAAASLRARRRVWSCSSWRSRASWSPVTCSSRWAWARKADRFRLTLLDSSL